MLVVAGSMLTWRRLLCLSLILLQLVSSHKEERSVPKKVHHFELGLGINVRTGVQRLLHMMQPPLCRFVRDGKWTVTCNQSRMACQVPIGQ